MTKQSGIAVLKKYGREHFRNLRKKVRKTSLENSGRKGGLSFIERYGKDRLMQAARHGNEVFKNRINSEPGLKEKYRKSFIEKMKRFTKIYRTKSGIFVRSKLEQKVADCFTDNNIKFEYESKAFKTVFGIYEPDFIIGNNVIEVFGMDTSFYISKKTKKLSAAIKNYPDFNWIVLNKTSATLDNCNVVKNIRQLLAAIRSY